MPLCVQLLTSFLQPTTMFLARAAPAANAWHLVAPRTHSRGNPDFIANNIRVKKDLDGLGSLGDLGWYCVRAALWAMAWQVPEEVVAHSGACRTIPAVV